MINTYLHKNLEKLKAISIMYINRFELPSEYDKFDLINTTYVKFNSESHFMGSFCKYMKLTCISMRREHRSKIPFESISFNRVETDFVVEFVDETDHTALVERCISLEQNAKHQKMLLLLGAGYSYDLIADTLELSRKNIRFHCFEAKRKLIERLKINGLEIKNNKKIHSYIDIQFKVDNAPLYNDYPFGNNSYRLAILFVLGKEKKPLNRHDLVSIIARNKGLTFDNCRSPFGLAVNKLVADGKVNLSNGFYSLVEHD